MRLNHLDLHVADECLRAAEAELWNAPQATPGGGMFYWVAPGRILIEVGWRRGH